MKIRSILFAFALGTSTLAVADSGTTTTSSAALSEIDAQVVAHLHAVDQLEIELGKLAQHNGTAPVKTYGQMLVKDHTAFDAKLVAFAKKHGVTSIPADESPSITEKNDLDAEKGKLETLHGSAFDQELLPMMAAAHDKEVVKANANIAVVSDGGLKMMLENVKPTLQKHADEARRLQAPQTRSSTPLAN